MQARQIVTRAQTDQRRAGPYVAPGFKMDLVHHARDFVAKVGALYGPQRSNHFQMRLPGLAVHDNGGNDRRLFFFLLGGAKINGAM